MCQRVLNFPQPLFISQSQGCLQKVLVRGWGMFVKQFSSLLCRRVLKMHKGAKFSTPCRMLNSVGCRGCWISFWNGPLVSEGSWLEILTHEVKLKLIIDIIIANTISNIWLNIPVYVQMFNLNSPWCGLVTYVMCQMHIYSNTLITTCVCMLMWTYWWLCIKAMVNLSQYLTHYLDSDMNTSQQ